MDNEIILAQQSGKHNKFWRCKIEATGNGMWKYEANWGRIGAPTGSSKIENNLSQYEAEDLLHKKSREKRRKGYTVISEETHQKLHITARIIGLQNKAEWELVRLDKNRWVKTTEEQLLNPDVKPGIRIKYTTRETTHGMIVIDGGIVDFSNNPISTTDERYQLYEKAAQAMAETL